MKRTFATRLLEARPRDWERMVNDELDPAVINDAQRDLDAIAIRAAFLARYIFFRSGCGLSHNVAAMRANAKVRILARALGYSYPHTKQFRV